MTAISASKAGELDPFDFIAKRLSRLLPLYYFCLAIFVALLISNLNLLALCLNLVLMQSWIPPFPLSMNFPGWFVSCIFSHLLFFPILFKHALGYKIRPSVFLLQALGFWAGTQGVLTILYNSPSFYKEFLPLSHDLIFYSPLSHLCSFIIGVALGFFYIHSPQIRLAKWPSIGFCCALLFMILGTLQSGWLDAISSNLPLGASFFAPAFGALVFSVAILPRGTRELFNLRIVHFLGEISFPVYLLQYPVRIIVGYVFPFAENRAISLRVFMFYFVILVVTAALFQVLVQERAGKLVISAFGMTREISKQVECRMAALHGGRRKDGIR
jgi:peptidoglycan/LPS O-acetylase OafA/YrhL